MPQQAQAICYQRDRNGLIVSASYEVDEAELKNWLLQPDSEMQKHGGEWSEITTPCPTYLPDSNLDLVPKFGQDVTKGIRAFWKLNGIYRVITYDRTKRLAFYYEFPVTE